MQTALPTVPDFFDGFNQFVLPPVTTEHDVVQLPGN